MVRQVSKLDKRTVWYVYILRCADRTLYTGVTTDVDRRVKEHNEHASKGAKYTRTRRPVTLVYQEPQQTRSDACKREWAIKKMTRSQKECLLDEN